MSTKGDIRALYAELERQGWRIEKGGKHIRFYAPGSTELTYTTPDTPGNPSAQYHNILCMVRTGAPDKVSHHKKRKVQGKPSFTCTHCGNTSHDPDDVLQRHCPQCHHFCDDIDLALSVGITL